MILLRSFFGVFVLALALLICRPALSKDTDTLPVTEIRNLHYGDVLFQLYQDQDFEAITRLNAYQHWGLLPDHHAEAQLLLGSLYLSLGLHDEAGTRFTQLLGPDVPIGVRNRAWFYLGKLWYVRGYFERSEQALRRVEFNSKKYPQLEAERQHLLANVLMQQNRFADAAQLLKEWRGPGDWLAYARFNLGVALIRDKRLAEADPILNQVGTLNSLASELLSLRDRANLALGFAYLQADNPLKAQDALKKVRLEGPYSNKALLGVGWAEAALGNFEKALTPWMELRKRNVLDAAVQEAYLSVPYAFGKLNATGQAAEYYEQALTDFAAESTRLREAVERIKNENILDKLLANEKDQRYGWFWQLRQLPDAAESRYLYLAFAGHDFQEGLKNYRDLVFMGNTLARWDDSIDVFRDMITTRETAYAQRIPRAEQLLATEAVKKKQQDIESLGAQLTAIGAENNVVALGEPEQQRQWAQIEALEAAAAELDNSDPDTAALNERLKLVKGVLYFQLSSQFPAQLWQQSRGMKALQNSLIETQHRWVRLEKARAAAPTDTQQFAARIASLRGRIDALQLRMVGSAERQNKFLVSKAIRELEAQQTRLSTYQLQARYSLATLYDQAASPEAENTEQQP
jgi:hypothetical protein